MCLRIEIISPPQELSFLFLLLLFFQVVFQDQFSGLLHFHANNSAAEISPYGWCSSSND